jgi:hypothetical protein
VLTLHPLPGKKAVPELAASQTEFWCPQAPRANSQCFSLNWWSMRSVLSCCASVTGAVQV